MVAQMPEETQQVDVIVEEAVTKEKPNTIEFENISSDFADIPEFEPIEEAKKREAEQRKTSLNDKLKGKSLQIGLNDKLAFIKHLFEGQSEDYDRVVSQINTARSLTEAKKLISEMVKPDYNNWEGKEEYEERFVEIVESKFN
jgi:DNA polymerase III alpha subunit (gram-positive type)